VNTDNPTRARVFMDILVTALRCDLTRYASFMLMNGANIYTLPWLGSQLSSPGSDQHTISHDTSPNGFNDQTVCTAYSISQVAYLLRAMKAVPEGSGTLLDHSLVYCSSEMQEGSNHNVMSSMPVILAGKGGGTVVTGRHMVFPPGTSRTDLMVSLLNWVGVPTTSFGLDGRNILTALTAP
jgi:hypothetical protein